MSEAPRAAYSTATVAPRRAPRTPQTRQSFAQAQAAAALEDDDE